MSSLLTLGYEILSPKVLENLGIWAENHIKYDLGLDANAAYRLAKSPWHSTIYNWFSDAETDEIILLAGSQSGKSTCLINCLLYSIINTPAPSMLVLSDESTTKAFSNRLQTVIKQSFPTLFNPEFSKDFGGFIGSSHLWLAWAGSEARCRSVSRKYIIADETSLYNRMSLSFLKERTKQFSNSKCLYASTPTTKNEQTFCLATQEFASFKQHYPCPSCGTYQPLEFSQLNYDFKLPDGSYDLNRVESETSYICKFCNAIWPQDLQTRLLQIAEPIQVNQVKDQKRKSLLISSLDVPTTSWGATARKYLESKNSTESLKNFQTQWLGVPYEEKQLALRAKGVQQRLSGTQALTCPSNTKYLLCAIDVQRKSIYAVVRAYLDDNRSTLVNAINITDASNDISKILELTYNEVINRAYSWENHTDNLKISSTIIDSGDGVTYPSVINFCLKYRKQVTPLKGYRFNSHNQRFKISLLEKMASGLSIMPPINLYFIDKMKYMPIVMQSYSSKITEEGAFIVNNGINIEYFNQMESWEYVKSVNKRGHSVQTPQQISRNDHYLIAECYLAALNEISEVKTIELQAVKPIIKQVKPHVPFNLSESTIRTKYF
jgi:hypothetical protein